MPPAPTATANTTEPKSLIYKDGVLVGEFDWRVCCASNQQDGGFMPKPFDTVPKRPTSPLRTKKGTRHMRHGPAAPDNGPLDTIPLNKDEKPRRDMPWTKTSKPKEFSRPPYVPEPAEAKERAAPSTLPPVRAGKVAHPHAPYKYMPSEPAKAARQPEGANMKAGRAPKLFDSDVHKGPHPVPAEAATVKREPIGRMNTNMPKKDTFGGHPKYMSDPYKDDPIKELDDKNRRWAKGKPNMLTCVCRGAPTIPIVNVWDYPACLQTKSGVTKGSNTITGENSTYLHDRGRFGTTQ